MPARATTSNRRPARGGSSTRPRSGSTAAKKRPPAKRGSAAARKPAPRKPQISLSAGAWRAAAGTWSLLARGAGGLARSVARPEEAEPLAPEHRRDGVGLAFLGLAIVIGAAAWTGGIGPVGAAVTDAVHWVIGSLVYVLPVVLFLVALRLLRHGPHPEARGRLTIGWLCMIAAVVGVTHVAGGVPAPEDTPGGAGGVLGWAVATPLTAGLGSVVTLLLLVLLAFFGLLVITATPVHQVPERLREYFDRALGRDEDDADYDDYDDYDEEPEAEEPPRSRRGRKTPAAVEDTLSTGVIDHAALDEAPTATVQTAPETVQLRRPPIVDRTAPPEELPPITVPEQLAIQPVEGNYT
ncbi:MAG: ftsK, partial [Modestobacter sp.]|nr:ftsK [Modestobacter sp.]